MFTPTDPNSQPEKPKNDNLDDLFSSSPEKPKNQGPVDDLFSSQAGSDASAGTPYTPPPVGQQPRRNNPILWIILGVVVAFMCICVACIAVVVGGGAFVAQNPTFQAGLATVQVAVGTGAAMAAAPTALPSGTKAKGSLTSNQQLSGLLVDFDQDVWTYNGSSGEKITVNITAQDKQQALVAGIYDTSRKLLVGTTLLESIKGAQSLTTTLPADGTYSILVSALGGTAEANGNYTITLQSSAR